MPKEINEKDWRKPEDIDYPEYYGHYRYMDWIYPFTVDIGTVFIFFKKSKKIENPKKIFFFTFLKAVLKLLQKEKF